MAQARKSPLHWFAVLCLLAAAALLLVSTISAPVIDSLSMMRVNRPDGSYINYGSFGYCILKDGSSCSGRHIGYKPANALGLKTSTFSWKTVNGLTNVMVLHPVAAFIAFVAFLCSLAAGVMGSLVAALMAAVAWIVTLIVMAVDFALFGIVRKHVNDDRKGHRASFSSGTWTALAAMILLFIATILLLMSCLRARKEKKRTTYTKTETVPVVPVTTGTYATQPRRFWQRPARTTY